MGEIKEGKGNYWYCVMGPAEEHELEPGCDLPMRTAAMRAFHEVTGRPAATTWSGWGIDAAKAEEMVGFRLKRPSTGDPVGLDRFNELLGTMWPEACSHVMRAIYPMLSDQTRKITAIKEIRTHSGWGLKEAKDFADFLMVNYEAALMCRRALVAKAVIWAADPRARDLVPPDRSLEANQAADFIMELAEDMGILPEEMATRGEKAESISAKTKDEPVPIWVVMSLHAGLATDRTPEIKPVVLGAFLTEEKALDLKSKHSIAWVERVEV
jgi:hypothetical protein